MGFEISESVAMVGCERHQGEPLPDCDMCVGRSVLYRSRELVTDGYEPGEAFLIAADEFHSLLHREESAMPN